MKAAFAVILAFTMIISAQSTGGFQNVGGEFGRNALKSLNFSQADTSNNSSGLWSWGNAPKGSLLVDGRLADDPLNTLNALNLSDGAIKVAGVDTYTGRTIYTYTIPKTGEVKYFYIDPLTQKPAYTDSPPIESPPTNATEKPYTLPAIFR